MRLAIKNRFFPYWTIFTSQNNKILMSESKLYNYKFCFQFFKFNLVIIIETIKSSSSFDSLVTNCKKIHPSLKKLEITCKWSLRYRENNLKIIRFTGLVSAFHSNNIKIKSVKFKLRTISPTKQ